MSNYIEEARFSDVLSKVSGDNQYIVNKLEKEKNRTFVEDRNLPKQTTLKKRYNNKKVQVLFEWNHNLEHDLVKRLENRTNLKSIEEFTEIFIDAMNTILPDYIGYLINGNGNYGVYLQEDNFSVIFYIELNDVIFGKGNKIYVNVKTVLSGLPKGERRVRDLFFL